MIFDCFTFYDEFMLLDMRLGELRGVVDRFVLVESPVTHQGRPKPLFYAEQRDRYSDWAERIIHVVADLPANGTAWDRENAQRRAITQGLADAAPDDLIISGDADEIPRADVVIALDRELVTPARLAYRLCYFKLNLRATLDEPWDLPRALRMRHVGDLSALRTPIDAPTVPDAGWHFSYLMPPERIVEKLETFAHVEFNKDAYKSLSHVQRCIDLGADLFGRGVLRIENLRDLPGGAPDAESNSDLLHPGRTAFEHGLAYLYTLITRYRERFDARWFDRFPYVFAIPAAIYFSIDSLRSLYRRLVRCRP